LTIPDRDAAPEPVPAARGARLTFLSRNTAPDRPSATVMATALPSMAMNELQDRRTSRLVLRRLTANDAAAVLAIDTDPRTNAHRPGGPPSRTESELAFQEFLRCWQEYGLGYWAVELGGHVVGIAGVRPFRSRTRECWNLYYRLVARASSSLKKSSE